MKKKQVTEVELTKEEFDNILKEALSIEGNINYQFKESGDYDKGDYKVVGIEIWAELDEPKLLEGDTEEPYWEEEEE